MTQNPRDEGLDDWAVFWGFLFGLIAGGFAALFGMPETIRAPRPQKQPKRDKLESAVIDPLADSIANGKAAARRRLDELGLDK
jgi:hypothetical protein